MLGPGKRIMREPASGGPFEDTVMTQEIPGAKGAAKRTVVIVCESKSDRALTRLAVERSTIDPHVILEAESGQEALRLVASTKVDVVILAAGLRSIGNKELVARIREQTQGRTMCVMLDYF